MCREDVSGIELVGVKAWHWGENHEVVEVGLGSAQRLLNSSDQDDDLKA